MFIEINDISTGTLVTEPLNAMSIDFVYKKEIDSKFDLIYVLTNGLRKVEQFDTEAEADDRLDDIKAIEIGGGGGGSYVLPVASASKLGGIKVGNNLSIDENGVLSASAGGDVLTLDVSDVTTAEILYPLIAGTSDFVELTIDTTTYPEVYQAFRNFFDDPKFGNTDINIYINNTLLTDVTIPATSNAQSTVVSPAVAAVFPFGTYHLLALQINDFDTEIYVAINQYAWEKKQDQLVSGENIKTINNQSIVGYGNLSLLAGLNYQGALTANNGNDGVNLATLDLGIYYGGNITQFSVVNNPSASQRANLSDYGVYIRRGYLFIMFKSYEDAEVNEDFAVLYGVGVESQALIEGIVKITKKSTTLGISIAQVAQTLTDVVMPSTSQTISGKKTFSTLPESSVVPTTDNQLVNKKYVDDNAGGLPFTIVDAHYTSGDNEFIFADKPVGCYLVHNGSTAPSSDITSRSNMSFRADTGTSTRVSVTAQWGLIYINTPYNDAAYDTAFGYALFANGTTEGVMTFKLQSITKISSGYRISFGDKMITNNNSPIKKLIRLYDSSSTYNVDDLVLNTDGWFYRCTTAVTTPESFDYNKWTNFNGYGIDRYIDEKIAAALNQ